jgi:hypothetical protein
VLLSPIFREKKKKKEKKGSLFVFSIPYKTVKILKVLKVEYLFLVNIWYLKKKKIIQN